MADSYVGTLSSQICQDIADAIRAKSGETTKMYPADFPYAIAQLGGGGSGEAPDGPLDVNFWDFDGSLVAAYTIEQAQRLTALPVPPGASDLRFLGWNWTLEEVRALWYPMEIGALYTPADGNTHLYVQPEGFNPITLTYDPGDDVVVTVDWGDGSPTESNTTYGGQSVPHEYPAGSGVYDITISATGAYMLGYSKGGDAPILSGGGSYALLGVFIGPDVAQLGSSALNSAHRLRWLTLGDHLTTLPNHMLDYVSSLESVAIPRTITDIRSQIAGYYCYGPRMVQLPGTLTSIASKAFLDNTHMSHVAPPVSATLSTSALENTSIRTVACGGDMGSAKLVCSGIEALEAAYLAEGTVLGQEFFKNCYNLETIHGGPYSLGGTYALQNCRMLSDVGQLTGDLPAYSLAGCWRIEHLDIPADCTTIGNMALSNMPSLRTVTVPASVAEIGNNFLYNCAAMVRVTMRSAIPPTLGASGMFSDCKRAGFTIQVPAGSREAYAAATNWSEMADYIVEV